jgi:CheY-like chemotaxis protein
VALILVIDDDGFYRSVIHRILEGEGHAVIEAENGSEGLSLYQEYGPALVMTDMDMPGMHGGEVIRGLRALDQQARIIAVSGISAFYDADLFHCGRELGADAVLRKLDSAERIIAETARLLADPATAAAAA